jgi:iron complex transport system ATP-binding protein
MIDAQDLTLAYGPNVVLRGVSMQLGDGELLAIIGPNGAGKSTLLRALGGLHTPQDGNVMVNGKAVAQMSSQERARRLALIEVDTSPVTNVTVREAVAQGRLPHRPWWRWNELPEDEAIVDDALERTQLGDRAERMLDSLSSGERQRVWVALALAQRAPSLLFDEPTTHLDLGHAMHILSLLREVADAGTTVIIVLHDLNVAAAHADRIALVGQNTLLACDVPERVFQEDLLTAAYGAPIIVRREEGMTLAFARPPQRPKGVPR